MILAEFLQAGNRLASRFAGPIIKLSLTPTGRNREAPAHRPPRQQPAANRVLAPRDCLDPHRQPAFGPGPASALRLPKPTAPARHFGQVTPSTSPDSRPPFRKLVK